MSINKDNLVEVPLDPEYLTEEGMYMAGYCWGRKIRSPKSGLPKGATDDFKRGVEDGYGDGIRAWDEVDETAPPKIKHKRGAMK